jgi:hypothetical protein
VAAVRITFGNGTTPRSERVAEGVFHAPDPPSGALLNGNTLCGPDEVAFLTLQEGDGSWFPNAVADPGCTPGRMPPEGFLPEACAAFVDMK